MTLITKPFQLMHGPRLVGEIEYDPQPDTDDADYPWLARWFRFNPMRADFADRFETFPQAQAHLERMEWEELPREMKIEAERVQRVKEAAE